MPTLFRPDRVFPLPADAVVVEREGVPHVRLRERGRAVHYKLTKDGGGYLKPAAKWAADVRTAKGRKRFHLSPNREASQTMLADILRRVENERAGVVDRFADHRRTTLADHVERWRASLAASGRGAEYVTQRSNRVKAAFAGCGAVYAADLAADRLETYLHDLRTKDGYGVGTTNDHLQNVRQFCRWMVANDRMERDPFARLKPGNVRTDVRRRRGELTPAEVSRLLESTAASTVSFRGLTGPARTILYRTALGTGFRVSELAALVPDHLDLAASPPVAVLPACYTKNRRQAVQPLPNDLAADLRLYVANRAGKEPVWPGTWSERSSRMLRKDIVAAGIPEWVDGPEGKEVRDFHSLRGCFISNVIRTGADLKQAMTLARHTDPRLTASRYARTRLQDLGAVVNRLSPVHGVATGAATNGCERGQTGAIGNNEATAVATAESQNRQELPAKQGISDTEAQSRLRDLNSRPPLYESEGPFPQSPSPPTTCADATNGQVAPGAAGGRIDAELARVVAAWPKLSEASRLAVLRAVEECRVKES